MRLAALLVAGPLIIVAGCTRPPDPPNIVIVVLDTVRADYVGGGESRPGVTEHMDRIAREGTTFTRVWANAPWTVPSHASMLTGLLPSEHGCTGKALRLDGGIPTVAEILSARDYETAAFFSNPWLTDQMTGMMRGFDVQRVARPPDTNILRVMSMREQGGPETIENVSQWVAQRRSEKPFFVFANFLEAHLPYAPPPDYRNVRPSKLPAEDAVTSRWAGEFNAGLRPAADVDWDRIRYLYSGDVWSADQFLGSLVRILEEQGLLDDTVIIVTSDHGENLGDHGFLDHQFGVFETLLSVPLVIRAPGRLERGVRTDPVMLTDIFATVLDLSGTDDVALPVYSRSLLGEAAEPTRPLLAEYEGVKWGLLRQLEELNPSLDVRPLARAFGAVRIGDLCLTVGSDGSEALHDLSSDPRQERNLAIEKQEDVDRLRRLLPAFRDQPTPDLKIDEQMREWLGALGYAM